jgi:hypothetical protein
MQRNVLRLGIAKAPNLIALNPLAGEIAKNAILIIRAFAPKIDKQFHDGRAMHARHAGDGAEGITLDQRGDNLLPFLGAQLVHTFTMLDRSSIV